MSVDTIFIPKQADLSDLRSWIAGELGASIIRLYVNNVAYTPDRVPTDFTEASFPGYAPIGPVAWGVPFINGANKGETDSPVLTWTMTALVGTYTVFGVYVTNPSKTVLLPVMPFLAPRVLTPGDNTITRVLQVTARGEL